MRTKDHLDEYLANLDKEIKERHQRFAEVAEHGFLVCRCGADFCEIDGHKCLKEATQ